jgi:NAD(P)-dependent dehydrogenase (short-subunit alcohol dehydrogenase family)
MSRTWIVTGCSSGIGRAIAEHVLSIGENVAVTARNPETVAALAAAYPDSALALALDVTDRRSVDAAVAATIERFGAIDVLVNNAGYGYVASIEEGDEAEVKAMFETNLFGALRMMKAVLPGMRKQRAGRIIQISSLAGRIANPATGYYASSKFALEAMSEALGREVADLGVKVCSIAPGMFRSDFSGRSLRTGESHESDYADSVAARIKLVQSVDGLQRGDPVKLARLVVTVSQMDDPPFQMIAGPDAYAAISDRMDSIRAAMEQNRELSCATDLDAPGA